MAAPAKAPFSFGESCTVVQADVLRYALIGQLQSTKAKTFRIDLSQIQEADVSLLQILVSLRATAAAKGTALAVTSNAFVDDLLHRAGLAFWNSPLPQAGA